MCWVRPAVRGALESNLVDALIYAVWFEDISDYLHLVQYAMEQGW